MLMVVIYLLAGRKICKFKAGNKNMDSLTQVCLGMISEKFDYIESEQVPFQKMFIFFQLIMTLLINLNFWICLNI